MSKTLVTGGTGLIGYNIVADLLEEGRAVRVLVRSLERGRKILPPGAELSEGDITDPESLKQAMEGVDVVYHAAGLPEQWLPDNDTFRKVNVEGARNVVKAALGAGVKKFIYTSTIDAFAGVKGEEYDESIIDPEDKHTYYERSKQEADRVVTAAMEDERLPAIFLHPSGLYGPGPVGSPGTNDFIIDLARGKIPMLLPGGIPIVYSKDVSRGHLLAEKKAKIGDRFILSESFHELKDLAGLILDVLGQKKVPPVMPLWIARVVSNVGEGISAIIKKSPLLPKGQLIFMQWGAIPSAARAKAKLGWNPVPAREGITRAVEFLKGAGRI